MAQRLSKRSILILAAVVSVLLFAAGLLSGLGVMRIAEERAEGEVAFFVDYVDRFESQVRSVQIQEDFVNSLDERRRCAFAEDYFSQASESLTYYWSVLPSRLEEYEQGRELGADYLALKEEYARLSLRAWIIARENERKCGASRPILYLYAADCAACVAQGETLDRVKEALGELNETVLVFTVDYSQPEPALATIKEYYGITSVPALVIGEHALQGRAFSAAEVSVALRGD